MVEDHPEAWRKSQRAGGIAFAAAGALCLVLSLFLQGGRIVLGYYDLCARRSGGIMHRISAL